MARYTGPKVRISRRLATNIFENEKGRKALERRPFPPGQHGRTRRRNAGSEYLAQLLLLPHPPHRYQQQRKHYHGDNNIVGDLVEAVVINTIMKQHLEL